MASTISGNLPGISSLFSTSTVAKTAETTSPATQNYTPLWLVQSAGSGNSFEMLGIRMPNANGDLAALLAEASLTLEKSSDENKSNRAKASLAALAGLLSPFDREVMMVEAEKRAKTAADTKKTSDALTAATTPLLADQKGLTDDITHLRGDIADVQAELDDPKVVSPRRDELEDRLTQLQGNLGDKLAARQAVDISLAEARITTLDQEVVDLQAQLDAAKPNSTEAASILTLQNARKAEVADARSSLADYRSGAKTPAARDAFSTATRNAVDATAGEIQGRLAGYQAASAAAQTALVAVAQLALLLAVSTQSDFRSDQADVASTDGMRDRGIEKAFEQIAEGLDESSARLLLERFQAAETDAAQAEPGARADIQARALAFVASLADILSTLARQTNSPSTPMPVPPDTVAGRVRLGV